MSDAPGPSWRPEELGAILRHQLAAPIEFDLGAVPRGAARRIRSAATAKNLLVRSFSDLLLHPRPPIELLRLTKDFAKANRHQPDSPIPAEIATLLYFASVAAALVRLRERITELDDAALAAGFAWCREQPWMEAGLGALFNDALRITARDSGESIP